MKGNVGIVDRVIRIVLVALVAALWLVGVLPPAAAIVLGIVALVLLATSIVGFCPVWRLLGISTRKKSA